MISKQLKEKQNFTATEKIIADYILINDLTKITARSIAKDCFTAPSTIVRFCQKLGFSGFNDFKEQYLQEQVYLSKHFSQINPNYPFSYNDKNTVIANKMGQLYHEIIDDNLSLLQHDTLQQCLSILIKADIIYIVSAGIQAQLAYTFRDKMLKIGKNVIVEPIMNQAYYLANFALSNSVFILISYSGQTPSIIQLAKKIKAKQNQLIAITSYGGNKLAKLSDITIPVSAREKLINNLGSFSMNLSTLLILDIIYMGLFNYDFQANFENKISVSKDFEQYRQTDNPMIKD